jgi:hypothetical protein
MRSERSIRKRRSTIWLRPRIAAGLDGNSSSRMTTPRAVHILTRTLLITFAALTVVACEKSVPNGRIRIKNDSQDREYNVVEVSGGSRSCTLAPREHCLLPEGTQSISFSRRYKDYTRHYHVSCPRFRGPGFTIKLIDVHLNRMRGGCKTTSASKG